MISIKKILLPTDFSECSAQAYVHALSFAKMYRAEIILLHVLVLYEEDPHMTSHKFSILEDYYKKSEKQANYLMDNIVSRDLRNQTKITPMVTRALGAAGKILDTAKELEVDIIIVGTHGRSGFRHFFVGSVTEKLIRYAPCPILTIRKLKRKFEATGKYHRILLPVDFSIYSKHALRYAFSLAREHGASVDVVHVVEQYIHPSFYSSEQISAFDIVPDLAARSTQALKDFTAEHSRIPLVPEYHILEGSPHNEIIHFAEENRNDLIVMGTRGLSGFEHFLVGSTTEKVVRKAECPILTVHCPEKEFIDNGDNNDIRA